MRRDEPDATPLSQANPTLSSPALSSPSTSNGNLDASESTAVKSQQQQHDATLRYGSLVLLIFQNCSAVLLMRYVQNSLRESFSIPIANLAVEVVKFVICAIAIIFATTAPPSDTALLTNQSPVASPQVLFASISAGFRSLHESIFTKHAWTMAVPAGLFTAQNNLLFVALANLDATLFQVTYQLKLLCTAVLMVLMLGHKLSGAKWGTLVMLFAGIVLTQIKPSASNNKNTEGQSMLVGMAAVVTCSICSAFASVYFEKILKGQNTPAQSSLAVRNVQLSVFSFFMNGIVWAWHTSNAPLTTATASSSKSIFAGFDSLVWILVLVQAAGGLLVAAVIKYANNILKGFATAVAIVVNGVVTYTWFEFVPTPMFMTGALVVILATMGYSYFP